MNGKMPYEAYIQTTRNYIPTTKKYIPTTRKDIPSTKKYILTTSKLHPNYEESSSQLRGRRSEKLKKCLISFNWGQIQGKYSHRGQYFGLNFIFTKFGFAPMFPFKMVEYVFKELYSRVLMHSDKCSQYDFFLFL